MHADRSRVLQVQCCLLRARLSRGQTSQHYPLSTCSSIRQFAEDFEKRGLPLHVLVNNAGVFIPPTDRTEEDFEVTLGINHFGPFYLTHLLLQNLEQNAPARIVNLG